jgi:hypothetical protein
MRHPLRLVLPLVAALLLLSIGHGLPNRYVPDDHAVRCALGIARDLGNPDLPRLTALVPPSGTYTTYPYLLPYLNLGAIGVSYVAGRATGRWHGAGEFAEYVFDDPGVAWLPARLVVALLTLLLPLAVYRAARELSRSRHEAALAALLAGTSLLVVQFAHTSRPWAPMVALGAVCFAASLRLRRRRRLRDVTLAAVFAALSTSTHPVGALFFALPVMALVSWRPPSRAAWAGLLAAPALALLVGFPYLLVYRADTGKGAIAGQLETGENVAMIGGQAFDLTRFGAERLVVTTRAWVGYDPVLVLLGLVGLVALARRTRGRGALLAVAPPLVVSALFLAYDGTHVRYLMPAVPFLAISAAGVLVGIARGPGRITACLAVLALAVPVVQAARLDLLLGREDTRTLAAREIASLTSAGDVLAVDGYGPPLKPSAASVDALVEQVWISRAEQRVMDFAAAGVPEADFVRALLPIGRFWKYDSYYATDYLLGARVLELGAFMQAWKVTHYVQVDRIPDEERRAPVTAWTRANAELIYELSPMTGSPPSEAALPTDMGFPLTQLWAYERPGPWIRVWRVGNAR